MLTEISPKWVKNSFNRFLLMNHSRTVLNFTDVSAIQRKKHTGLHIDRIRALFLSINGAGLFFTHFQHTSSLMKVSETKENIFWVLDHKTGGTRQGQLLKRTLMFVTTH